MDGTNYPLGRKIPFDLFKDELIKGQDIYENNFYIYGIDKYDDYDKLKSEFESLVQTENNRIYTSYYKEEMLAFAYCSIRSEYVKGATIEKVAYIEAIYVEEEYRNFGIATHFIKLCEKWAKEQGITQIASDCKIDNLNSIKLHLSNGFNESVKSVHFIKNI